MLLTPETVATRQGSVQDKYKVDIWSPAHWTAVISAHNKSLKLTIGVH